MKILSPQQIHEWDAYTIEQEPIASIELMERAARQCTDYLIDEKLISKPIKIFCGKGNNGGDGLAIARQLMDGGIDVIVYILEFGAKGTDDFQTNLHRLHQQNAAIHFIQSQEFFPGLNENDLIIDALFGSGLNRPLENLSAQLVQHINKAAATVVSIDVPSGMFIDKSSKNNTVIVANHTLTFQSLKLCFLVAENESFFGEVKVLDINLHASFLQDINARLSLVEENQIRSYLPKRKAFSHKGTYGHALLVAGNKGKMGAAILAARACLRTGLGLLTVQAPEECLSILQTSTPEAMCVTRDDLIDYNKYACVGMGPGIGIESSKQVVENILQRSNKPIVIDADALNIIASGKELLNNVPAGSILTPHPKEFERLFGVSENDFDRIELALKLSIDYSFIIVLKGHYTLIAHAGNGWFNTTGNAGMAKGGSGDVLTGILTSLLAQGYVPLHAALTGVYLHGLAADIAIGSQSEESLLPSDIIAAIGNGFNTLQNNHSY